MLYIILICLYHFMFFVKDITCCVFYIYFRLGNNVNQKASSYLSLKWVVKQRRQLTTSTMHLAQELMNVQCSGGSRSFAKEMRALKARSTVASHQKLTTTSGEQSLKLIFGNRKTYQRIQRQSFYSCMTFEANWKSEKLS